MSVPISYNYIPIRDDAGSISISQNERIFTQRCIATAVAASSTVNSHDTTTVDGSKILRTDGRTAYQIRNPIRLHFNRKNGASDGISTNSSSSSSSSSSTNIAVCTCQWGPATRVHCSVSGELLPPSSSDRNSEGSVVISVDISPSANTSYRQTAPSVNIGTSSNQQSGGGSGGMVDKHQKLVCNKILRCLERMIVLGGVLDTEALCEVVGQWVWKLTIAITVVDAGGNIVDAAIMAAMAALRHYRKPIVQMNTTNIDESDESTKSTAPSKSSGGMPILISPNVKEPTPLPLQHTPLSISFALITSNVSDVQNRQSSSSGEQQILLGSNNSGTRTVIAAYMDPTLREELISDAIITIGLNVHGEICLYEFSGGIELQPYQLRTLYNAAQQEVPSLFASFEKSVADADEQSKFERLQLLQQQQQQQATTILPPLVSNKVTSEQLLGIPYFQRVDTESLEVDDDAMEGENDSAQIIAQNEAEEAYRRQALDYNIGHIATKIRDDDNKNAEAARKKKQVNTSSTTKTNSLLSAMLQSVAATSSSIKHEPENVPTTTVHDQQPANDSKDNDNDEDEIMSDNQESHEQQQDTVAAVTKSIPIIKKEPPKILKKEGQSKTKPTKVSAYHDSDDEEEDEGGIMQLTSEFVETAAVPSTTTKKELPSTTPQVVVKTESNSMQIDETSKTQKMAGTGDDDNNNDADPDDDDDIDDLAAAIKKKSKKDKKKSKKK